MKMLMQAAALGAIQAREYYNKKALIYRVDF